MDRKNFLKFSQKNDRFKLFAAYFDWGMFPGKKILINNLPNQNIQVYKPKSNTWTKFTNSSEKLPLEVVSIETDDQAWNWIDKASKSHPESRNRCMTALIIFGENGEVDMGLITSVSQLPGTKEV